MDSTCLKIYRKAVPGSVVTAHWKNAPVPSRELRSGRRPYNDLSVAVFNVGFCSASCHPHTDGSDIIAVDTGSFVVPPGLVYTGFSLPAVRTCPVSRARNLTLLWLLG